MILLIHLPFLKVYENDGDNEWDDKLSEVGIRLKSIIIIDNKECYFFHTGTCNRFYIYCSTPKIIVILTQMM